jgi:hypothetical protein
MRTTRKRMWLGLTCLLLFVGMAGSALILATGPKLTKANFDKIEKGMSVEEVERLLGTCEAKNVTRYGSDPTVHTFAVSYTQRDWRGMGPDTLVVVIYVDDAVTKQLYYKEPAFEYLSRIKRKVGLK